MRHIPEVMPGSGKVRGSFDELQPRERGAVVATGDKMSRQLQLQPLRSDVLQEWSRVG